MHQLPALLDSIRPLTAEEDRRLNVEMPNPYNAKGRCVTCHGKGDFRWYAYATGEGDSTEVVDFECPHLDQYLLHRYLLSAGIGLTYQRLSWRDLMVPIPEAVLHYLNNMGRYVDAGMGLVLHGRHGNGKSLLSTLIAKAALANGIEARFVTWSDMIDRFAAGWYDQEARAVFHKSLKNTTILVIDDVGKEYRPTKVTDKGLTSAPTGPAASLMDEVLRHRLAQALPTILTTNLTMDDLGRTYGEGGSVASLLTERSVPHEFVLEDFRGRANQRFQQEVLSGLVRPIVL